MMVQKEDLGLSLSLKFPHNNTLNPQHLNLMSSSTYSSSPSPSNAHKPSWNNAFASSDRNLETCRGKARSFLHGIDVNRLLSMIDCEEEARVSSPSNTILSVSGKRSVRGKKIPTSSGRGKRVPTMVAHEALYVRNREMRKVDRRRSYLPYQQDLVRFFVNLNTMGKSSKPKQ